MDWLHKAMARCASTCGTDPFTCLESDEVVTQYGREAEGGDDFHATPRTDEPGLSVQRGQLSPSEICRSVRGEALTTDELEAARARYSTAGALRDAGFSIVHTPTKASRGHATVVLCSRSKPFSVRTPWPKAVSALFDACFNGSEGDNEL
jgi:hypothetical protein